ncbi:MAG: DUF5615 family PIN-like protein [Blastocatellia bacterium]
MRIQFQADADFNQNVVRAVRRRRPAIDFQTADEAGRRGLDDSQVPALAAREACILVTYDRHTMPQHFSDLLETISKIVVLNLHHGTTRRID